MDNKEFMENYKKKYKFTTRTPNYAYEPYWHNGHWVFTQRLATGKDGETTDKTWCDGGDCPEPYKIIGKVCGLNQNSERATFDNFCDLERANKCRGLQFWRDRWAMVYHGPCAKRDEQDITKIMSKYYTITGITPSPTASSDAFFPTLGSKLSIGYDCDKC